MKENTKKTVKVKGPRSFQDKLNALVAEHLEHVDLEDIIGLSEVIGNMNDTIRNITNEILRASASASHQDQVNAEIMKAPVEKSKLEPIVQERFARNRLPYKVSYGVSLASCGNTLPRASVVVGPKNDMMPMCMCIQEISAHRGTDPQKDLYISGSHNAQDDRLDVVFSVNTNGVYFNSDLRSNSFSALSFGAVKLTIADLFDVLKIYGFFEDFRKRTGYMTKCDAATFLHGIHIIPAVGCDSQLIMDIVMPGQYDEVLFTAIAMEYLRLFMVTWASRQCLPKANDYNANVPSFNEIFYINLITDTDMVIDNIWRLIDLINASRENDQKSEERTGVVRRENYE